MADNGNNETQISTATKSDDVLTDKFPIATTSSAQDNIADSGLVQYGVTSVISYL